MTMAISCDTLRTLAPFDSLSEEYLSRVQGRARLKRFACGTLIFKRGQALSESFYLVAGDVDLINAEFAVTSLAPGSRRSRFPLNDASPSKVSAIARSAVELLSLERDFLDLVMAWSQSSDFSVTALKDQQVEVGGGRGVAAEPRATAGEIAAEGRFAGIRHQRAGGRPGAPVRRRTAGRGEYGHDEHRPGQLGSRMHGCNPSVSSRYLEYRQHYRPVSKRHEPANCKW